MYASSYGRTDTAVKLIENGADVNAKDIDGWNALMCASFNGQTDTAEKLLKADGIKIDEKNNEGDEAYALAMQQGHEDLAAKLLIKRGISTYLEPQELFVNVSKKNNEIIDAIRKLQEQMAQVSTVCQYNAKRIKEIGPKCEANTSKLAEIEKATEFNSEFVERYVRTKELREIAIKNEMHDKVCRQMAEERMNVEPSYDYPTENPGSWGFGFLNFEDGSSYPCVYERGRDGRTMWKGGYL